MGHSVSYKEGAWNDMGDAINRMSAWRSGIFDRMRAMDQVFRNLRDTVDDLDEDHRIHFSYKSMSGSLDKLNDDYQKLYNFTSDAGEAVSRHIDHPFFTKMDAFVEAMEKISIDKITTKNTLNVKELQSTSQLASVATYEKVKKKEITLDDIFSNDRLMETSLKSEYETFKALATSKKAEKVTFDQYKEAIQYSRGFNYKSIRDKQIDKEFWVNLGIGTAIVILTIACPPAGAVASITYSAMQMTDAVTGTSMISGRKLSTEERITEGAFGLLDLAPGAAALRGAGAFGALGRTGAKGMTKIGDLTKAMGQASSRRLMDLRRTGSTGLKKVRNAAAEQVKQVKQSASDIADRMPLGGMQPAMAGGYGTGGGRISDQLKNTFQQITSKERVNHEIVYNKAEGVQGVNETGEHFKNISTGPRYGERRISDKVYNQLRGKTPSRKIQRQVNEHLEELIGTPDPALPGKTIDGTLQADHIVSMDKITKMEGFETLTREQQIEVLNHEDNFVGLSEAANKSKGSKSYSDWTIYKKEGIEVSSDFREQMMLREKELEVKLQRIIDELNNR